MPKTLFALVTLCLTALLTVGLPDQAHAYLDSGSGSTLVQWIVAAIAGIKRFWSRITGMFASRGQH